MDKSGASVAMTLFKAVVEMKMKINVTCSVGLVENFIGPNSYRPSDII
jgi:leucyl aminopeptidase